MDELNVDFILKGLEAAFEGGSVGNAIRAILGLVVLVMAYLLSRRLKKMKAEAARRETEAGQARDEASNAGSAGDLQDQMDQTDAKVQDILNKASFKVQEAPVAENENKGTPPAPAAVTGPLPKHTNNGDCPRCALILKGTYAPLLHWFKQLQKEVPTAHASCGPRGKAAQEDALAKGLSKAGWGESSHNFACAIDLFEMGGKDVKNIYENEWFTKEVQPRLTMNQEWYGIPGHPFRELPHVEWKEWRTLVRSGAVNLVDENYKTPGT